MFDDDKSKQVIADGLLPFSQWAFTVDIEDTEEMEKLRQQHANWDVSQADPCATLRAVEKQFRQAQVTHLKRKDKAEGNAPIACDRQLRGMPRATSC